MWTPKEARKVVRNLKSGYALARRLLPVATMMTRQQPRRYVVFAPLLGTRGPDCSPDDAVHVLRRAQSNRRLVSVPIAANAR